jgi:hypothetical protein
VKEFVMTFSFTKVPRAKGGTQKIKTTQPYFPNNFIQTVSNKQPFRNGVVMLQHTKKTMFAKHQISRFGHSTWTYSYKEKDRFSIGGLEGMLCKN